MAGKISSLLAFAALACIANACRQINDNQCRSNAECCSGNCWKGNSNWATGVCKEGQGGGSGCRPINDNQCRSNQECCSGNCWKGNSNWATGVCKEGGGGGNPNPPPPPPGGGTGGSAAAITQDQFNRAVTQNGYPTPTPQQYEAFKNGLSSGEITIAREAAMFLAQLLHESMGLTKKKEIRCANSGCPGEYEVPGCDVPGKRYYGRGYIQLTWCYNYRAAGQDLGMGDDLVNNPDLVADNEGIAWKTAFSFWKREVRNGRYGNEVKQGMFGSSTRAINGQREECQGNGYHANESRKRFDYYKVVFQVFGVEGQPDERGCPY